VDGEGSIQINSSTNGSGKSYWGLTVQVSGNCGEVLTELRNEWNLGSVTKWRAKGAKEGRHSYNWRLYSKEAETLLNALLPHLRIKRQQAEVALNFRTFVAAGRGSLTAEMSAQRNALALQMKTLNQRYGKGVETPFREAA
jgi:hypothetical protein